MTSRGSSLNAAFCARYFFERCISIDIKEYRTQHSEYENSDPQADMNLAI